MNIIPIARHDCLEAQRLLDAYIDSQLQNETNLRLHRHFARCRHCQQLLEGAILLKRRVRGALHSLRAPAGLRTRIQQLAKGT